MKRGPRRKKGSCGSDPAEFHTETPPSGRGGRDIGRTGFFTGSKGGTQCRACQDSRLLILTGSPRTFRVIYSISRFREGGNAASSCYAWLMRAAMAALQAHAHP